MNTNIVLKRALLTGFVGGVLSCMLTLVLHYFKIIEISPKDYLTLLKLSDKWLATIYGTVFTIIFYGVLSIGIASIYYLLFKKKESLLMGIFYGVGLFILIIFAMPLLSSKIPHIMILSKRSITTSVCLFILYGTFIGYSISFDFKQMQVEMNEK